MTERKSPFHVGELQAQARAGVAPPAGAGIRDFMPDQHRAFFAQLPFVLLGAIDDRGWPAASVLTGPTGFAASPDPWTLSIAGAHDAQRAVMPGCIRVDGHTLTIPDFKANRYFNTFGNLMLEPRAALLSLDFQSGDLLPLQGHAEVLWEGGDELRLLSGAERLWRLHVERGSLRSRALGLRWSFREL